MASKKRLYKPDTIYLSRTVVTALQPLFRTMDVDESTVRAWVGTMPLYCHKQALAAIEHLGEWLASEDGTGQAQAPDMAAFRAYLARRFTQQTLEQYARRAQAFLTAMRGHEGRLAAPASDEDSRIARTTPALARLCELLGTDAGDAELWALHRQRKFRASSAMTMLNRCALWLEDTGGARRPSADDISAWRAYLRSRYCSFYARKHLTVLSTWLSWVDRHLSAAERQARRERREDETTPQGQA